MGEKMVAGVPGYPAAGFLMALVLLTADARTSILSGILVIWLTIFAFLMKNLLGCHVPAWSRDGSVLIGTVSLSWCVFRLADSAAGLRGGMTELVFSLTAAFTGLLCGCGMLYSRQGRNYSRLLTESAVLWVLMILMGMVREFMAGGQMLGLKLASDWPVFSPVFRSAAAGLVFGGLALSLTWNPSGPAVRKGERISEGILLAGLLAVSPPMGGQDSLLWRLLSGAILIAFLYGTGKRRQFAPAGPMPGYLMSLGFFYMILTMIH